MQQAIDILNKKIKDLEELKDARDARDGILFDNEWSQLELLKELFTEIQALGDGWIPVTERFPEDNTMVLGYIDFIVGVELGWATEYGEWKWDGGINYTHWQPLPLPPNK